MRQTQDTYLGWQQPEHLVGCTRPVWSVDFRTDPDEWRDRYGGDEHSCPNDSCGHGHRYAKTTIRVVCTSCQAALVIRGEECSTSRGTTSNTTHGYGLPPRRVAGLLLWPGEPRLNVGRLGTDEPYDLLVTRPGVKQAELEEEDVVGQITQTRGKRGGVVWTAAAVPTPRGPYGAGLGLRWANAQDGFKTIAAAAKWINAKIEENTAGGEGE